MAGTGAFTLNSDPSCIDAQIFGPVVNPSKSSVDVFKRTRKARLRR